MRMAAALHFFTSRLRSQFVGCNKNGEKENA